MNLYFILQNIGLNVRRTLGGCRDSVLSFQRFIDLILFLRGTGLPRMIPEVLNAVCWQVKTVDDVNT